MRVDDNVILNHGSLARSNTSYTAKLSFGSRPVWMRYQGRLAADVVLFTNIWTIWGGIKPQRTPHGNWKKSSIYVTWCIVNNQRSIGVGCQDVFVVWLVTGHLTQFTTHYASKDIHDGTLPPYGSGNQHDDMQNWPSTTFFFCIFHNIVVFFVLLCILHNIIVFFIANLCYLYPFPPPPLFLFSDFCWWLFSLLHALISSSLTSVRDNLNYWFQYLTFSCHLKPMSSNH